ncbi:MAG: M23 family metallopeptidase [Chloroflexota bacterium]
MRLYHALVIMVLLFALPAVSLAQLDAADILPEKPMIMPAAGQAGPNTWMFGQAYGNTTGAYNFGDQWYRAGQGLHFGVDLSMPCGTQLVAVADGIVQFVDDKSFGSDPHNLILRHEELGLTTLYGHLLNKPNLIPGQSVQQGDVVGLSGDPDSTCVSRPHLHFEVRSLDYSRWINPVDVIEANWDSLATIGPFGYPLFQQDLENPRQWVSLEEQPDIYLWGRVLNNYNYVSPPGNSARPEPAPQMARDVPEVMDTAVYSLRQVTSDGCCANAQWHPTAANTLYVTDGPAGSLAGVFEYNLNGVLSDNQLRPAPLPYLSASGAHEIEPFINAFVKVRHVASGTEYQVNTGGRIPTLNTENSQLLWYVTESAVVPGQTRPNTSIYMSDINGENTRVVYAEPGAFAMWMDDDRILLTTRNDSREYTLRVLEWRTGTLTEIGMWKEMRGISVAPGGRYVSFYVNWQEDPAASGVYMVDTLGGISVEQMPWFGGWRWRDSDSVYYVPFQPEQQYHTLRTYDLATGDDRLMVSPELAQFTIADGYWQVSADGARILFQNAADDRNLYVLEPEL